MRGSLLPFASLALVLMTSVGAGPAPSAEDSVATSAKVKALPAAVQKTVRAEGRLATLRNVSKEKEDGKMVYEVEMRIHGRTKDIVVGADGTLLVSEEQVILDELEPAVRATITKEAGKRKIRMIESVSKLGKLEYYEAHVVAGKELVEIKVGLDGSVIP